MVEKVTSTRYYDTSEMIAATREKAKNKYLDGELTEAEYVSTMSQLTAEDEIAENIETMKAQKYQDLQEQFENDEITDEELEEEMDRLFQSGDDFLEEDPDPLPTATERASNAGASLKAKARYYAPPVLILAPIAAVVLIPGISPMLAVTAAVPLLMVGLVLYGAYWANRNL